MKKSKAKFLRYEQVDVERVFEKESELLAQIQSGELEKALILWQTKSDTLVLPSGSKWQHSQLLEETLADLGWGLYQRKTGGAPVPQVSGVVNVSYLYTLRHDQTYSIPEAYQAFCNTLSMFFKHYNIEVAAHATPGSYCDGDYNLNIEGKKVVGTAQRVVLKPGGGKVVLAQACILLGVNMDRIIDPVNLCYSLHGQSQRINAEVHTSLSQHTKETPSLGSVFERLYACFAQSRNE